MVGSNIINSPLLKGKFVFAINHFIQRQFLFQEFFDLGFSRTENLTSVMDFVS